MNHDDELPGCVLAFIAVAGTVLGVLFAWLQNGGAEIVTEWWVDFHF